jgi:hypothetical protein
MIKLDTDSMYGKNPWDGEGVGNDGRNDSIIPLLGAFVAAIVIILVLCSLPIGRI